MRVFLSFLYIFFSSWVTLSYEEAWALVPRPDHAMKKKLPLVLFCYLFNVNEGLANLLCAENGQKTVKLVMRRFSRL